MLKKRSSGIPFYEFEIFQEFRSDLRHAIFTRHTNIRRAKPIQDVFETETNPVAFKKQLHGIEIHFIDSAKTDAALHGDVLITNRREIPLLIQIADCASVLIFDPLKRVIANIHAGWRGLVKGVIRNAITRIIESFGSRPENLRIGISPMIGPCCCRFSKPEHELPQPFHIYIRNDNMVDLWGIAEGQLRDCSVAANHIENARICTACNPEDFFSYRREGAKNPLGRFGTAIMLR